MPEIITNLINQVQIPSSDSIIEGAVATQGGHTLELSPTTIVHAYGDVTNSLGVAKVGIRTDGILSWGTAQTYLNAATGLSAIVGLSVVKMIPLTATTFLIAYKKASDNKGYVKHGTVDTVNKTISWGVESAAFSTGTVDYLDVEFLDTDRGVITFQDAGVSNNCMAVVVINTAGVITFGTVKNVKNTTCTYTAVSKLTSNTFVISYFDATNSASVVCSEAAGIITVNAPVNFLAAAGSMINSASDTSTSFAIVYQYTTSTYVIYGTISGTVITFGTPVAFVALVNQFTDIVAISSKRFAVAINHYYQGGSTYGCIYIYSALIIGTNTINVVGGGSILQGVTWYNGAYNNTMYMTLSKIDSTNFSITCGTRYQNSTATATKLVYVTVAFDASYTNVFWLESGIQLIATGKAGGYTEISSITAMLTNSPYNNWYTNGTIAYAVKLYLKGTSSDKMYRVFPDGMSTSTATGYNSEIVRPNCPIILNDGDKLYASLWCYQTGVGVPVFITAMGIDVEVT